MPDINDMLLSAMLQSGVSQYPDKKLYQAATMLKADERPTVPVRVGDNDPKQYPILRIAPHTEAITNADPKNTTPPNIRVFRGNPSYDSADPRLLAAVLAHEAVHAKRQDYEEVPAYEQQRKTLGRLGYMRDNPDYMRDLNERISNKKHKEGK